VEKGTIIDVGAGFGTFCEQMKESSYFEKVIGIEPSPDYAKTCRDQGLEIIEKPIEEIDENQVQADVITSFEVIEHLFEPRKYIEGCRKILNKEGLIVITCPNFQGFDINVLKKLSNNVDVEHINYFNPESLSLLVKSCGFEVIEVMTPGVLDAELVRKKILSKEFDVSNKPFLKKILIDKWEELGENFQRFLINNKLSSNLWIVAKKIDL